MQRYIRTTVLAIGRHRNAPRIYIEGRYLIDAGFEPGTSYSVVYRQQSIDLAVSHDGRSVSGKRDNTVAVIDLHNEQIAEAFGDAPRVMVQCERGRIVIRLARTLQRRRERQLDDRSVALFAGGGLLSEAARQAGFRNVAAIDVDGRYGDIHQSNHGGHMINASVEEIPWDQLAELAPIGLLEMGIPCEPFSAIRRLDRGGQQRRDRSLPPEAHELGDMVYWALKAVDVLNPHTVVIEEVPRFLDSGAAWILQHALRRMAYTVDSCVISPLDFGALTGRRRAVVIATTLDEIVWPRPEPAVNRMLGELFDKVSDDSDLWFDATSKPWLYEHWRRQTSEATALSRPSSRPARRRAPQSRSATSPVRATTP